jgi:DNA-binding transcriptional MerR regulator
MYSIGEMSRQTGVKIPTIRYYEQMGLLQASGRSAGNQRRYGDAGLERLSFIRHARDLGLTIENIRELARLSDHPERPCAEAHRIAARHLASVVARIAKLRRLQKELKRITGLADAGHVGECHVIRALADHRLCLGEH